MVKKIKRPAGLFPSLPNGMDETLKRRFDKHKENGQLPLELKRENITALPFHDEKLLARWRDYRAGLRYIEPVNGITLMGLVDTILEENGKLIVLDFKTRGSPLKDHPHYYQDQLNIYNFLLRKNGFATEDFAYLLFYSPEDILPSGEFIFKTQLIKMPINVANAEELFNKAIKVVQGEIPQKSSNCQYCNWAHAVVETNFLPPIKTNI